jgi:hypothetical protein
MQYEGNKNIQFLRFLFKKVWDLKNYIQREWHVKIKGEQMAI